MTKKLYRSQKNRMLLGVCGGIGEYLDVDPTVIRFVWVIATLVTALAPGIIAYLACGLIIPEKGTKKK